MAMNAAPLSSPRLQRVLTALRDGKPHSSWDLMQRARVVSLSAVISELRTHGAVIACTKRHVNDAPVYFYTLVKGPTS